jgi:hypothetical protein
VKCVNRWMRWLSVPTGFHWSIDVTEK